MSRAARIADALRVFAAGGRAVEIRGIPRDPEKPIYIGWFDRENLDRAASVCLQMEDSCTGVYFVPNTISDNFFVGKEINRIGIGAGANDSSIARRDWLLIDIDPVRPRDCSANDAERREAWKVLLSVYASLRDAGLCKPFVAHSGNGWHLVYPIDLPNTEEAKIKIKSVLYGLHDRCSTESAKVDKTTFNASRIWKLYGTIAKKGDGSNPERPHRESYIARTVDGIEIFDTSVDEIRSVRERNTAKLSEMLDLWDRQERARLVIESATQSNSLVKRAQDYLAKVPVSISGQGGHAKAYHAACVVVEGFGLSGDSEALEALGPWNARCQPPWSEKELLHKIDSARKASKDTKWILRESGGIADQVAVAVAAVADSASAGQVEAEEVEDATAEDIYLHNASTQWAWERWIQKGAVTCIAAEPGIGKTRLLMDLAKRIYRGESWPDGSPASFPVGSKTVWIPSDGQWAELADIPQAFDFPRSAVVLNSKKTNPFAGTDIDSVGAMADLTARVLRHKPALVIVDTIGSAISVSMSKPEDAKKAFKPFSILARATDSAVILVTHLNAAGGVLGRRIEAAVRQLIMLSRPDPEGEPTRRRLWVSKSSHLLPPPLGVTMGDGGNIYDFNPPSEPSGESGGGTGAPGRLPPGRLAEVTNWLVRGLEMGPRRVSDIFTEGRRNGYSRTAIDQCRERLDVESYVGPDGQRWWRALG